MYVQCRVLVSFLIGCIALAQTKPGDAKHYAQSDDRYMHPKNTHQIRTRSTTHHRSYTANERENYARFWNENAQNTLNQKLLHRQNTNIAKNVIIFLGDGLSIPTIKAARVYLGQLHNESGEETVLSFEKFPYVGLSKTYCVDKQVGDSACTSTAYLGGVKSNEGTIGVTAAVKYEDCDGSLQKKNRVESIGTWSQLKGKKTGVVTTTRVTHASPAGVYAHTANRNWENDADNVPPNCIDIAQQLITFPTGRHLNVILGGGRRGFLPNSVTDEEGQMGYRLDGQNLIETWLKNKEGTRAQYVWNRTELLHVPKDTEYLLGLFEGDHCKYHLDAEENDPSLAEMTQKAIELLSTGDRGYFLFVEGGRIDHAHHDTKAHKALDETVEFHKAIQKAVELTDEDDTLIVVTADHAHTMSVNGYADRGNDIFGMAGIGNDEIPYMTLSYANGPGYKEHINGHRQDASKDDTHNKDYEFPATAPLHSETHGGDDVAIYARGPWSHLLTGVVEQNVIPHIMAYASCVGDGLTICKEEIDRPKR